MKPDLMRLVHLTNTFCLAILLSFFSGTASAAPETLPWRTDLSQEELQKVLAVIQPAALFAKAEKFEQKQAGSTTSTRVINSDAFSHFSENLSFEGERDFKLGNGLFKKIWVSSPSSTRASDGLGPLFNARSCQRCHLKDGRGHPPESNEDIATSMFLRLSVPPRTEEDKAAISSGRLQRIPEPTYGGQLQDQATPGLPAEGRMLISYREEPIELSGGETATLRHPSYSVGELAYGPMADDVMLSPRIAQPMIGLGLLEAIHEGDILALADPDDLNKDGISGKPSMVLNPGDTQKQLGRFGWKASNSSVRHQSANAFAGDIGISTPDVLAHWGDCTTGQKTCLEQPNGVQANLGTSEAPDPVLDLVTFYSRNLAVPARRDVNDPVVLAGKKVFYTTGCASCHQPKFVTRRDAAQKELQFQLIWPYSDLLLHDMGDALADGRPVGDATGREWRTAPLWGIGLTQTVNGHSYFLHDGRARSLLEAVLWHGGEAQVARDKVIAMPPEDRKSLIRFLESL
ncbi:di-heme oxidoredictase family protein [Kiloniella laminariae]|uniref:di-heme oxidoreductase family protein n=1 Tax=Kiloniella laminariae TaxID=454162 RepID=UPI0003776F38|nr:di-heme oxidoredictase family protein [Kiloniella laminariae]